MTLAGILLPGKDELVLSAVHHHRTDLILRKVDLDRYDDRDFVSTNPVEGYERIMAFVPKHLPDPFYLEGDVRTINRNTIFREVASRICVSPMPGKRPLITAGCLYCLISRKNINESPHRGLNSATGKLLCLQKKLSFHTRHRYLGQNTM